MRFAVLCSVGREGGEIFADLLGDAEARKAAGMKELLVALAAQTAAANRPAAIGAVVAAIDALPDSEKPLARELIQAFVAKLPPAARAKFAGLATGKASAILKDLLADAVKTASDEQARPAARAAAIRTLGLGKFADAKSLLVASLAVRQPPPVQLAALEVLGRFDSADVPEVVLAAWKEMSPQIRATATETLLSRPAWVNALLDAVEKGTVRPTDLDPARVQLLQKSADEKVRDRAMKLFTASAVSKRTEVIAKYQKALELKGDSGKGKAVFKEKCAACHRLEGVGEAVGPDLASIKNRGAEAVLTNILDPNREVMLVASRSVKMRSRSASTSEEMWCVICPVV